MTYGKKLLFLPLFIVFLILFSFFSVNAQTPSNYDVTVSPVFFDLSSNPGESVSDRIRIRNNTSSPIPIKIEIKRLTGDVSGDLVLRDSADDNSLSWLKFEEVKFTAKPLEWTNVPFTIDIPDTAAYGYYFAVTFKQDEDSPLARTGAKITGAAAVPILLNVRKEGAKIEGKFVSFNVDANWYEYPPVKLLTTFENIGNVHIRPHGNIFIKDSFGRQVAVLDINSKKSTILPNTKKIFESIWADAFIVREPKTVNGQIQVDKNGKTQTNLKIRWDKLPDLRIGKYTATAILVISTDTKDIPFQSEVTFFVMPWKIVLGVVIFILFLIYREIQVRKLKKQVKTLLKDKS